MDVVTLVVGVVLVFTCLALYELFRKVRCGDVCSPPRSLRAAESESSFKERCVDEQCFENTALVADELPPTQTGAYRVKSMLDSTRNKFSEKNKFEEKKEEFISEIASVEEIEDSLPDPFN